MIKWLRTYSKQIMVIVFLLAMFSFVGGSALVSFLSPNADREVVGRALGEEIKGYDLRIAMFDTHVLERIFTSWQYDEPNRKMTPLHWYLLAREAEKAGIVVSEQEVQDQISRLRDMFSQFGGEDYFETLRTRDRITLPEVRRALSRHLAIQHHAEPYSAVAIPSEPQMRHYVRDTQEKLQIRFAGFDTKQFIDPRESIPADQLQAHFDKYRDVDVTDSEDGFGYRFARRVKLQYVVADVSRIGTELTLGLDEIKTFWRANRSKYTRFEEVAPASAPASQAASQPAESPRPIEVEKSLGEARAEVERDLRSRKAVQVAEQAMRQVTETLLRPWRRQRIDNETGYRPIPEGVQGADDLRAAAERVSRELGITLQYGETGLLSERSLENHTDLAGFRVRTQDNSGITLVEYAFRVPAFHPVGDVGETELRLQRYEPPDAPLWIPTMIYEGSRQTFVPNKLCLFRVIEAEDARPARDLDEVRAKVEEDLSSLRAYERVEPLVKEVYAAARRLGLSEAAIVYDHLVQEKKLAAPVSAPSFARKTLLRGKARQDAIDAGKPTLVTSPVFMLGISDAFVDGCFEMVEESWTSPEAPDPEKSETWKKVTTRPAVEPTPVVRWLGVPRLRRWFIIEKLGYERVNEEKYASARAAAFSELTSERSMVLRAQWFKPQAIEKRTGYEKVGEGVGLGGEGIVPGKPVQPMPTF